MGQNYNPWHLFGTNHIGNSNPTKPTTQNFGNEQTYHHKLQPQINQEVPNKKKIMESHKTRNYERDGYRI
jgi:hypothetical protein